MGFESPPIVSEVGTDINTDKNLKKTLTLTNIIRKFRCYDKVINNGFVTLQ